MDFLIQRGKELVAVEVKARETLSPRDFKGLQAIAELEAVHRRIMVFLGQRPFKTEDGIEALPAQEFLGEIEAQGCWIRQHFQADHAGASGQSH